MYDAWGNVIGTYTFFSAGKTLITIGVAGQYISINLSSVVTVPLIIGEC